MHILKSKWQKLKSQERKNKPLLTYFFSSEDKLAKLFGTEEKYNKVDSFLLAYSNNFNHRIIES